MYAFNHANLMKYFRLLLLLLLPVGAFAQQGTPEEEEKKLYEMIQTEVTKLETSLDLETWQVFYVDSILTHDYQAMRDELMVKSAAKVSNTDIYVQIQDKWMEQIYNAFSKVFDEDQWTKYLKQGAGREKKARDKRAAKRKSN